MSKYLSSIIFMIIIVQSYSQTKTLEWHYRLGGTGTDYGVATAIDSDENIYDVAIFNGTASIVFNLTFTSRGGSDILIRKSTSLGIRQWIRQLGSTGADIVTSIGVDISDNVYVIGTYTDSLYLDNQFLLSGHNGSTSSFILKLSSSGTMLWVNPIHSTTVVELSQLTVDSPDELLISGNFEGTVTLNDTLSINSQGGQDVMMLKVNGLSGDIIYHKHIGSPDQEFVNQHARDNQNNIYLLGNFRSLIDLNPGSGTFLANSNGQTDIFLVKLNSMGEFLWARTFGGIDFDDGHSLATDADRNVVITGRFSEIISFGSFEHVLQSNGGTDIFLTKLNENGQTQWARKIGGSQNDQGSVVKIGQKNIIYLGGLFRQTVDFNPKIQFSNNSTSLGGTDGFIGLYNYDGTYNEHFTFGGQANDFVSDFVIRGNGEIISTGGFSSIVDFDPSSGVVNIFSSGGLDGFLWSVFVCVNPYLKSIHVEKDMLCFGERVMIEITEGYLNDATQWSWQRDSCENITFASGDLLNVRVPRNTIFYVKGFGGCISNDSCSAIPIKVFTDTLNYQYEKLCEGDSIVIGNNVYRSQGLFIDSLLSVSGCDSVVVLEIELFPQYFSSGSRSICNGDTLRVGNSEYTLPGTYTNIFQTLDGCDSTIVTQLNVLPSRISSADARVCKGDSVLVGTEFYFNTGTYIQTSTNEFGCTDQLVVTIQGIETEFEQFVSLCQGDSVRVGNTIYKTAGAYQDKLISTLGCDSIINSFISILMPSFTVQDLHLCFGDSILVGHKVYKRTGIFLDTLVNAVGCDSIIETSIRIFDAVPKTVFNLKICEGDSIVVGQNFYKESGFYIDTLLNVNGCDSIIETQLNVSPKIFIIEDSICMGDFFAIDTFLISETGIYSFDYINELGCDSTLLLNLVVLPNKILDQEILFCKGDSIDLGFRLITALGIYRDTLSTIFGCDSVVVTHVITNNKTQELNYKICQGSTIDINGILYDNEGIFTDTIVLQNNCDSILNIKIAFWPINSIDTVFRICRGEQIKIGNNVYEDAGNYSVTLGDINGCDSIINFRLEIISFIPTFSNRIDTLFSPLVPGAIYQWYRCMNGVLVPILGASGSELIIPSSGEYALAITYLGCTYFTDCVPIIKSSTSNAYTHKKVIIYPNPTKDYIYMEGLDDIINIHVIRSDGHKMLDINPTLPKIEISTENWSTGMYFVQLCDALGNCITKKILKIDR